jgi:aspartyl-tRNA(Asn)/glutamyl-tRNA(Gln) amidotransferase subunit C
MQLPPSKYIALRPSTRGLAACGNLALSAESTVTEQAPTQELKRFCDGTPLMLKRSLNGPNRPLSDRPLKTDNRQLFTMALDTSDVAKIAHLARLAVNDDELEHFSSELSNILSLVEQMNAIDTTGVEPMAHPLHMTQRLRPDQVSERDQREHFQRIAPQTDDGLYLVPKVIE